MATRAKNLVFTVVLIASVTGVWAQEIYLKIGFPIFCHFSCDYKKNILIYQDYIIIQELDGLKRDSIYVPAVGEMVAGHNVHFLYDRVTFSKKGSGYVYQVIDGKVTRVDRSLDHNFQRDAIEFVRNDTLFRHGGRGFWEARNFFTFFSNETFEWEIVRPVKGDEFPPGLFLHQAQLYEDEIFIYGGFTINPLEPTREDFNEVVWKFNFKEQSWTRLGKLSPAVLSTTFGQEKWRYTDVTKVSKYKDRYVTTQQWLYKINLSENKIWNLPTSHLIKRIDPRESYEHFIFNEHIYFYQQENHHIIRPDLIIFRVPLSEVNDESASYDDFYIPVTTKSWYWGLLVIPGLAALFLFRKKVVKKNKQSEKAVVNKTGLRYKEVDYSLSSTASTLLQLLLSEQQEVPSSRIVEITSRPGLDYPNQVRLKNQVIRSLNLELRSIFRTNEDLIRQTSSAVDRRIKCYKIDRSFFEVESENTL
ncbi:MAG: hypothetical protein ACO3FI_03530 [Cyclobacteriaceae bacterium]